MFFNDKKHSATLIQIREWHTRSISILFVISDSIYQYTNAIKPVSPNTSCTVLFSSIYSICFFGRGSTQIPRIGDLESFSDRKTRSRIFLMSHGFALDIADICQTQESRPTPTHIHPSDQTQRSLGQAAVPPGYTHNVLHGCIDKRARRVFIRESMSSLPSRDARTCTAVALFYFLEWKVINCELLEPILWCELPCVEALRHCFVIYKLRVSTISTSVLSSLYYFSLLSFTILTSVIGSLCDSSSFAILFFILSHYRWESVEKFTFIENQ